MKLIHDMPRIGIAGLSCECCTFSPLLSREEDFVQLHGNELLSRYPFLSDYPEYQWIPLIRAGALPGGPIEPGFYDRFKTRLLEQLDAHGPWDGLFLHMHGAANVLGRNDAEGDLLTAIRQTVGPDCLISASYDLHGNMSQKVVNNLDVLTAYRTAPHIDWFETIQRACSLLVRCIKEDVKPVLKYVSVPVLLPGEQTSTEYEPAAGLYGAIPEIIQRYDLLDASILIGYLWADEPRSTASVVTVGFDPEKTDDAALELAQQFWDARHEFKFGVQTGSVDECIQWAETSIEQPVIISDSGDNPTAGGAGDISYCLERLLALQTENALCAGIADRDAVRNCHDAGVNAEVQLSLGGKLDSVHGHPLAGTVRVVSLHTVPWAVGNEVDINNRIAVVQTLGVTVIITERRTPFHYLRDFTRLGIDPTQFKVIIVKIGYLVPELDGLAALSLLALSPGAVNQDILSLEFNNITRPIFPLDEKMEWSSHNS